MEDTVPRNYKKEYENYHSRPEQKKNRAARNAARRKAIREGRARKGDGKDVHHVKPFAKGGSKTGATRTVSKKKNRSFKRTKTAGMK
jgi:hypothetical protein